VLRLMRERIDTLADPLDPGFGFDAILLDVPAWNRLPGRMRWKAAQRPMIRSMP
jgi:protein ImuB